MKNSRRKRIPNICCRQAHVKNDEGLDRIKQMPSVHSHKLGAATTAIAIRTFTDSTGSTGSPMDSGEVISLNRSHSGSSALSVQWYDAQSDWDAEPAASAPAAPQGPAARPAAVAHAEPIAATELPAAVAAPGPAALEAVVCPVTLHDGSAPYQQLPPELANIVKKYKAGSNLGCKPAVAMVKYMEANNVTVMQLQQQLAPLLQEEEAQGRKDLPVPAPEMTPLQRTQSLRTASQQHSSNESSKTQQPWPSVTRLLDNVRLAYDTMSTMQVHSDDGFKQVSHGNLELWYKHDIEGHCQVIRARTVLDEPIEHAVCLAREVDLVTQWNPAISEMKELGGYSSSEILAYMLLWAPWPLPQPEVINYAVGLDLLDTQHGGVFIGTKSGSHLLEEIELPQHPRAQRLTMNAGGFLFKPLPPDPAKPGVPRTEAFVLVSIDASKWLVPDAVISFVLKVFAPLVYKSVIKVLKRIFHTANPATGRGNSVGAGDSSCGGSALLERLAARPEYSAIAAHVRKHLAGNAAASASAAAVAADRQTGPGPPDSVA